MKNWVFLAVLAFAANAFASGQKFSEMDFEAKHLSLVGLADVLPGYIEATEAVLEELDGFPCGVIDETTRLGQKHILDLFSRNEVLLRKSKFIEDTDFAGGRDEHDVAWLRESLVGLRKLLVLVQDANTTGVIPVEIDKYLWISSFKRWDAERFNFQFIVEPVSRFYCNLTIRGGRNAGNNKAFFSAYESCD